MSLKVFAKSQRTGGLDQTRNPKRKFEVASVGEELCREIISFRLVFKKKIINPEKDSQQNPGWYIYMYIYIYMVFRNLCSVKWKISSDVLRFRW